MQPNVSVTAPLALKPEHHHNVPKKGRFRLPLVSPDVELVHIDTCRRYFLEGANVYLVWLCSRVADRKRGFAATDKDESLGL
jgi:hypothetical protein